MVTSAQHILSIGRDVGITPAGQAFGPWIPVSQSPAFHCVVSVTPPSENSTDSSHLMLRPEQVNQGEIMVDGASYALFPVPGIAGLGYVIRLRAEMGGLFAGYNRITTANTAPNFPGLIGGVQTYTISHSLTQNTPFTASVFPEIRLVKTHTAPLPATLPDTVFDAVKIHPCGTNRWFDSPGVYPGIGWPAVYALCGTPASPAVGSNPQHTYRVSLKFNATNATCTTPTLTTVKLPMVREADFTGAGSTPAAGEVAFALTFENCPPHMTRIHYQLQSAKPSPNPASGLVALSDTSTATGVAVQVVHDVPARTPHPFNVWDFVADYTPQHTAPGTPSTHTIPLRARYYQVGAAPVTADKVEAAMLVHIIYQ